MEEKRKRNSNGNKKAIASASRFNCACGIIADMKITFNPDPEIVKSVQEGLKRTGGYCPCMIQRSEETKCMCKEFRAKIEDPDFEGFCHCLLYHKSK